MRGFRPICTMLVLTGIASAIETSKTVPVSISHEKGKFSGQLSLSVEGQMNKAKVAWQGNIRNDSGKKIFRATFCIKAFDATDVQVAIGEEPCLIRLWGNQWESNVPLSFKGNQRVKLNETKTPIAIARYTVEAIELFDQPPNLRVLDTRCNLVWPSLIRVFADSKFRPTVLDKESLTATFAYDGGRVDGYSSTNMLRAYTSANTAFLGPTWESFRIDSASVYLRDEGQGTCSTEVKMSFAGFGKPMFGQLGWYAVDSNFLFEKGLLDQVEGQSKQAANADIEKAIRELPATLPKETLSTDSAPQLTITSEPAGAEIEINGEFVGSTPSTVTVKPGSTAVTVKKSGFQPWKRNLNLTHGDKRTLQADLRDIH